MIRANPSRKLSGVFMGSYRDGGELRIGLRNMRGTIDRMQAATHGGGLFCSPDSSALLPALGLALEPAATAEPDMMLDERDTLAPESFITMANELSQAGGAAEVLRTKEVRLGWSSWAWCGPGAGLIQGSSVDWAVDLFRRRGAGTLETLGVVPRVRQIDVVSANQPDCVSICVCDGV